MYTIAVVDDAVYISDMVTEVQDKVSLLMAGAADYLTKPFDTRELLTRITVQLRLAASSGAPPGWSGASASS